MRKTLGWLILMTTLVGMWLGQFALAYGITIQTMAPWAGFWYQPEPGDWERSLNDFFLFGPGSMLVALAVVLISMAFFWRIISWGWRVRVRFIMTNLVFMVFTPLISSVASGINTMMIPTFPGDSPFPTYYTQILPAFSMIVLTLVWVVALAVVTSPDKRKRKQHTEWHDSDGLVQQGSRL